jgi:hypothetical protein
MRSPMTHRFAPGSVHGRITELTHSSAEPTSPSASSVRIRAASDSTAAVRCGRRTLPRAPDTNGTARRRVGGTPTLRFGCRPMQRRARRARRPSARSLHGCTRAASHRGFAAERPQRARRARDRVVAAPAKPRAALQMSALLFAGMDRDVDRAMQRSYTPGRPTVHFRHSVCMRCRPENSSDI